LLLLSFTVVGSPQAAEPEAKARPRYKSPLGLAVDEKGKVARAVLTGSGVIALVDLGSGKVVEEELRPSEKARPQLSDRSVHWETAPELADRLKFVADEFNAKDLSDATNLRGMCFTKKPAEMVLVAHQRAKSRVPTSQVAQGWVFVNALTIVVFAG